MADSEVVWPKPSCQIMDGRQSLLDGGVDGEVAFGFSVCHHTHCSRMERDLSTFKYIKYSIQLFQHIY